MTPKEFAKKIIASINPGTADISGIGDGTIKGAISEQNKNIENIGGRILAGVRTFPETTVGKQIVNVSFGVELPNKPKVVLAMWADNQSDIYTYFKTLQVSYDSYTTTGFQAIADRINAGGIWKFVWIAIY